jgi:hypothetical protein
VSEYQNLVNEPQTLVSEYQNLVNQSQTLASEYQNLANQSQTLASEYQNLSAPSFKSPQPFRFFVLNRHIFNNSSAWPPVTPANHLLNSRLIPFKNRFHATIG